MNRPVDTLQSFYRAFLALDSTKMAACYAPQATFADPLFQVEGRERIGAMWQMLCNGAIANGRADWRLEVSELKVEHGLGRAYWEPKYRFGASDRRVHNCIDSEFTFTADGLIASQRDHFDMWRWSRQALGMRGVMFGWMPWFRKALQRQAKRRVDAWLLKQPSP